MRAALLEFDDSVQISLESQLERLALESTYMSNVFGTFKSFIPSIAENLKEVYRTFLVSDHLGDQLKDTRKLLTKLKPKLAHSSLVSLDKTVISVPEGFKGNLLEYADTLLAMSEEVFQESNKVIGEYSFVLSAFITNREDKISLQDHSNLFARIAKRRQELTKKISFFFPTSGDLPKAYLGSSLHRLSDVEELVTAAEKINGQRQKQSLEDLSSSVKKCTDLLSVIVEDTKRNGSYKISGPAAMNISKGAYEVARYVEFVSLYRFKVEQLVVSTNKLVAQLDTLM